MFRGSFAGLRRPLIVVLTAVSLAGGCGGDGAEPSPPGGGTGNTPTPPPLSSRLAWSQAAPTEAAVQGYLFALFIDGTRNSLDGANCAGGASPYECSAQLPAMSSGRHVLELVTIDPGTGAESNRSAPLVVGQQVMTNTAGETGHSATNEIAGLHRPFVTCATGDASLCFNVRLAATGLAPVRRLVTLPGARMLVLHENGHVTFLPSGISEPLDLGRPDPGSIVDFADVAVDPDFETNRFLYFAAVATAATGHRSVNVFRARELADRVGEAAMIVSLPASPAWLPAIGAGVDERLYVAMPATGTGSAERPYDGRVLRFTRDGAAAGNERLASPIVAMGSSRPVSLAWDGSSRLLVASADSRESPLAAVALSSQSLSVTWPATALPVGAADASSLQSGLRDLSVAPPSADRAGETSVSIVGADPAALYVATLASGSGFALTSLRHVPLGQFVPTAVTFAGPRDIVAAGRLGPDGSPVGLLRLRANQPRGSAP